MDIAKAMKNEMTRIAQKEARKIAAEPNKKAADLRRLAADLRRRVDLLEKTLKATGSTKVVVKANDADEAGAPTAESKRAWFTGAGVLSLRKRLRLSQVEMGRLCGVSQNCICAWESKKGKLPLRRATTAALEKARGMSMTEAHNVLSAQA